METLREKTEREIDEALTAIEADSRPELCDELALEVLRSAKAVLSVASPGTSIVARWGSTRCLQCCLRPALRAAFRGLAMAVGRRSLARAECGSVRSWPRASPTRGRVRAARREARQGPRRRRRRGRGWGALLQAWPPCLRQVPARRRAQVAARCGERGVAPLQRVAGIPAAEGGSPWLTPPAS